MNFQNLKTTLLINGFSLLKLPLLAFITPNIVELTDRRARVRVRLGYRTRNHLGAMYFGALSMGAELSIAVKAVEEIAKSKQKIDFLFKNFSCEFLKRADGHVEFVCDQSALVADLIRSAALSPDRMEREFEGYAVVPSKGPEPIMKYKLVLSVKNRSIK